MFRQTAVLDDLLHVCSTQKQEIAKTYHLKQSYIKLLNLFFSISHSCSVCFIMIWLLVFLLPSSNIRMVWKVKLEISNSLCFTEAFQKMVYHLYTDSFSVKSSLEETVMVLKWLVEEYKKYPPEILFLYCKELSYWKSNVV